MYFIHQRMEGRKCFYNFKNIYYYSFIFSIISQTFIRYVACENTRFCQLENQIKPIRLSLREDKPVGVDIVKLNIIGEEGKEITSSMRYNKYLRYNQTTKIISLTSKLDAEIIRKTDATIECRALRVSNSDNTILVLILIEDVNDNPPEMILPQQPVIVDEVFVYFNHYNY